MLSLDCVTPSFSLQEGDPTWYGPSTKRVRGRDSVPPGDREATVPASRPLRAAAAGPSAAPPKSEPEDPSRAVPLEEENTLEADRYIEEADKASDTHSSGIYVLQIIFIGIVEYLFSLKLSMQ